MVTVALVCKEDGIELAVENAPAHIPEEQLPHLFEAFYRGSPSVKQSSGLDLYMTRMIFETYSIPHRISNTKDGVKFTVEFKKAPS